MRRGASTIAALLAGALLAGCGAASQDSSEDFDGVQADIAAAIEGLQEAGEDGDARRICNDVLASALRERTTDCEANVDDALDDVSSHELQVTEVTIDGDEATARVEATAGSDTRIETLTLVREGNVWRISALG